MPGWLNTTGNTGGVQSTTPASYLACNGPTTTMVSPHVKPVKLSSNEPFKVTLTTLVLVPTLVKLTNVKGRHVRLVDTKSVSKVEC